MSSARSGEDLDIAWQRNGTRVVTQRVSRDGAAESSPALEPALVFELSSGWDDPDALPAFVARIGGLQLLPPYDATTTDFSSLPSLRGVDVRWRTTFERGLWGDVSVDYYVTDGRPVSVVVGSTDPVDVWFSYPFERHLLLRLGRMSSPQTLSPPARLEGDLDAAMLVAGLVDPKWLACFALGSQPLADLLRLTRLLAGRSLREISPK